MQKDRQHINSSMRHITEKGKGAYGWDFGQWQLYFVLTNKGDISTEGWVPELEQIEKNAIVLKPGQVLQGMWHKKHPIELTINTVHNKTLKATLRFKKLKNGLYENPVEITQTEAGKLNLVRFVEDGSKQSFISQRPKGNAKRCYVWRISIQDKDNAHAYKDDGTLQLCP